MSEAPNPAPLHPEDIPEATGHLESLPPFPDQMTQATGHVALTGTETPDPRLFDRIKPRIVNSLADDDADRPEANHSSDEILKTLLFTTNKMVYDIVGSQPFRDKCHAKNIDPYDDTSEDYWQVFEDFTAQRADVLARKGASVLSTQALRLAGATPRYVFSEIALNKGNDQDRSAASAKNKPIVTKYNGMIRDFATQLPETRATELEDSLKQMMNKFVYGEAELKLAGKKIKEAIRGARHEVGFEQILKETGLNYRHGTDVEDMQGGDFFVGGLGIDAKASLHSLRKAGATDMATYVRREPAGKRNFPVLMMYSLLEDEDFVRDGFFVSDELAKQRAVKIRSDIVNELAR